MFTISSIRTETSHILSQFERVFIIITILHCRERKLRISNVKGTIVVVNGNSFNWH